MAALEDSSQLTITINNGHECSLSKKACQLWQEKQFCDLQVKVGEETFDCHSIILAAQSEYFEKELRSSNGGKKTGGSEKNIIDVTNICSKRIFELVLDFIYSGKTIIPIDMISTFLKESKVFQIETLKLALDVAFCPEIITLENVTILTQTSYEMKIDSLKGHCLAFLCETFQDVVSRKCLLELNDMILKDVLIRDELLVDHEDEVLDAVLLWAEHIPAKRCKQLVDVLKLVSIGFRVLRNCHW